MSCACRIELAAELGADALFDEGVEAARNACVAGATLAAAAITASAWYDNPLSGAPALRECMARLGSNPLEVTAWQRSFAPSVHPETHDAGFAPGFGFVSEPQAERVLAAARRLAACPRAERLRFYLTHAAALADAGALNPAGLAALVFCDHALSSDDAEGEYLLCRVGVALREAARARRRGLAHFPFFSEAYCYEGSAPRAQRRNLRDAMQRVGL